MENKGSDLEMTCNVSAEIDDESFAAVEARLERLQKLAKDTQEAVREAYEYTASATAPKHTPIGVSKEDRTPRAGESYRDEYCRIGIIMLSDLAKHPVSTESARAAASLIAAAAELMH